MTNKLSYDNLLVMLYRTAVTLRRAATTPLPETYNGQLWDHLNEIQPMDWIAMLNKPDLPVALKVGQLLYLTPATDKCPCLYTVTLLDGTVTTWKNVRVTKLPTRIFNMSAKP